MTPPTFPAPAPKETTVTDILNTPGISGAEALKHLTRAGMSDTDARHAIADHIRAQRPALRPDSLYDADLDLLPQVDAGAFRMTSAADGFRKVDPQGQPMSWSNAATLGRLREAGFIDLAAYATGDPRAPWPSPYVLTDLGRANLPGTAESAAS
jgi:hypothetical protein